MAPKPEERVARPAAVMPAEPTVELSLVTPIATSAAPAPPVVAPSRPPTAPERPAAVVAAPVPLAVPKPARPKEVVREPAVAAPAPPAPPPMEPIRREPPRVEPARPAPDTKDTKVVPLRPVRPPEPVPAPAAAAPAAPVIEPPREIVAAAPAAPAVPAAPAPAAPVPAVAGPVERELLRLPESVTVAELAEKMRRKAGEVIRELVSMGVMVTINQLLDVDKAKTVATRFGFDVEVRSPDGKELFEDEVDPSQLRSRPPVVTVMGHVDHGKTSLLDASARPRWPSSEAGGITQHIGAYQVATSHGKPSLPRHPGPRGVHRHAGPRRPGHRHRGPGGRGRRRRHAADRRGHQPRQGGGVPIIVAINKIDKPDANPDRVKQELANTGWSRRSGAAQTIFVNTSAKKGTGVDKLLEMIALQAEMLELKANPDRAGRGVVVEAKLDRGRGPVATVLIQQGTLREGDIVVAGHHYGKVRAMFNDRRQRTKAAGPVDPVEILGLSGVPSAGDTLIVVDDERRRARSPSAPGAGRRWSRSSARVTLADLHKQIDAGEVKELRESSSRATCTARSRPPAGGPREPVDRRGQGPRDPRRRRRHHRDRRPARRRRRTPSSSDSTSSPNPKELASADRARGDQAYKVIYEAIEDIRAAMKGMLAPVFREVPLGRAEVRELFPIPNIGTIAGCSSARAPSSAGQGPA